MRRTSRHRTHAATITGTVTGIILCLATHSAHAEDEKMTRDRAAILAMTGNYAVTFDFHETVALQDGYDLKDRYVAHAKEIVRVIEDRDDFISLQHLLVGEKDGKPITIKHWRQDWAYEPAQILEFRGNETWVVRTLDTHSSQGTWSQAVYQVDDSPRYAGVGHWRHDNGVSRWTSEETWRPLPRRDATKRDDYDVMVAINRHTLTPTGWVHEQDNAKLALRDGTEQIIAHEIGTNAYEHDDGFDITHAEAYWTKTQALWKSVRDAWNTIERESASVKLHQSYDGGTLWDALLALADNVENGSVSSEAAIRDAAELIDDHAKTTPRPNAPERADTAHLPGLEP